MIMETLESEDLLASSHGMSGQTPSILGVLYRT